MLGNLYILCNGRPKTISSKSLAKPGIRLYGHGPIHRLRQALEKYIFFVRMRRKKIQFMWNNRPINRPEYSRYLVRLFSSNKWKPKRTVGRLPDNRPDPKRFSVPNSANWQIFKFIYMRNHPEFLSNSINVSRTRTQRRNILALL